MPHIEDCKVLSNEKIAPDYYKISFSSKNIQKNAYPGQFVEIKLPGAFLRRPFSFHEINKNGFSILFHVVGKATKNFSKFRKGSTLNVIGPLGTGFKIVKGKKAVLIGGGAGIAPLAALEKELRKKNVPSVLYMGAKTKDLLLCRDDFSEMGSECAVCTDDGTEGPKCTAPALFLSNYQTIQLANCVIYSCGPAPMLKAVADIAKKKKIKAQLSLETHMACGIGICFGCAVKTTKGMRRVCKEGPVFDSGEIIWD